MTSQDEFREEIEREVTDMERALQDNCDQLDKLEADTEDNARSLRLSVLRLEAKLERIEQRLDTLEGKDDQPQS